MAAPTYFGSTTNPADNGTAQEPATLAVTPPASMVAGDLVFLVGHERSADNTLITLSEQGGQTWNGPLEVTAANNQGMRLWWAQFDGTWDASPSLAFAAVGGNVPISATMHVFRPASTTNLTWRVDQTMAGGSEASADPIVVSDVTPTKRDNVTLAAIFLSTAPTVSGVSGTGWTGVTSPAAQFRNTIGSDQMAAFAYRLQAAPAATADASFDLSGSATGISFTLVMWADNTPPSIALNTADETDFGSDTTPTLEFTGTDGNADDVRYQVQIDSASTFDSQAAAVDDSYSESNQDAQQNAGSDTIQGRMQSFTSNGGVLDHARFYLKKTNSPTGNATAKIYAHSGTYGTSSVPTGAALATSDNFDVSTLTDSLALTTFSFSGGNRITLEAGTQYVVTFEYAGGTSTNLVLWGFDNSSPSHGGNQGSLSSSVWTPVSSQDGVFYVYTKGPLLNEVSGTDSGFANTVSGGDTDPFNSGEKVSFTVQAGDALADGTYYWRARALDPNGGNTWSAWPTARTFTILTVVVPSGKKLFAALLAKRAFHFIPGP